MWFFVAGNVRTEVFKAREAQKTASDSDLFFYCIARSIPGYAICKPALSITQ